MPSRSGQVLAEDRVGVGVGAAQAVVHVDQAGQPGPGPGRQRRQHVEQGDRIRATRDRHEDPVPLTEELVAADGRPDAGREASHGKGTGVGSRESGVGSRSRRVGSQESGIRPKV